MAVIEFEHVSKAYRLGASRTSLRETITQIPRKLFSHNGARTDDQLLWALDDVSFRVERGEVLGIIGPNGAGKSTMLKLLSKVTFPTRGHIRTQGRMAALIELGAGFHPDLSGRENVYLNGSILGLTRQEIDTQFSDIVEFAGLERFIDTPVKRYSSGMYVRLAFAVAAHVKADLLLIDEVLSVGDMAFQQRCMEKMNELRDSGTTIVFVSHNLWNVEVFCRRALLLRAGRIVAKGNPAEVIGIYRRQEREDLLAA
jgi:lipopolysaccharide transport system ATP-binding protein